MPKFRKKPVVIEAVQWDGNNLEAIIEFTDGRNPATNDLHVGQRWEDYDGAGGFVAGLKIFTLGGPLKASIGDWIIKGVKGECYPCKPDIFAATYEAVED